ncbi:MAG: glycosyltransferase family 87 protein [Fimbriiglobus sp.]
MRIWGNWLLLAAMVWFGGLLGLGIEGYLKPRGRTVFDIYVVASRAWCAGEDLYPRQAETAELYRYSPAFAVITAPLSWIHPGLGNGLWKVINGLVFLGGVFVWSRRALPGEPLSPNLIGVLALLTIPVAVLSLHIGQANLLMTGLILFGVTLLQEEKYWSASVFLAAATLTKVVPFAFALVLMILFWRLILPYLTMICLGLVTPFLCQKPSYGLTQTQSWLHHLVESGELNRERLRSLDKLLELGGYTLSPQLMLLLGVLAGGAVLLVGVLGSWRCHDRRLALWLVLAWFLNWVLLFSPATEKVTYSIIAPVLALAIIRSWQKPRAWLSRMVLILSLLLMGLVSTDLGKPLRQFVDTTAAPIFGALLFQFWLIADTRSFLLSSLQFNLSPATDSRQGA